MRIEVIRWETVYYSAHETFQQQIPEPPECDVMVGRFVRGWERRCRPIFASYRMANLILAARPMRC